MLLRLATCSAVLALMLVVGSRLLFAHPTSAAKPGPTVYTAETAVTTEQSKTISVSCPAGMHATGGGGWVTTAQAQTFLTQSVPITSNGNPAASGQPATGWQVTGTFDLIVTNNWALRVYAVCS